MIYVECSDRKNLGVLSLVACNVLSPLSAEDCLLFKISIQIIMFYLSSQTEIESFDLTKFKV